jgi:cold-inducible RNA-binding protein
MFRRSGAFVNSARHAQFVSARGRTAEMRIYVGGISYSTNTDGLRRLFEQCGTVSDATIVEDKYSGQSKGFGFVEMPNNDEANAAIAKFNGYNLDGRSLTVNEARPREERGGGGYGGGGGRSGGGYGGGNRGGGRW